MRSISLHWGTNDSNTTPACSTSISTPTTTYVWRSNSNICRIHNKLSHPTIFYRPLTDVFHKLFRHTDIIPQLGIITRTQRCNPHRPASIHLFTSTIHTYIWRQSTHITTLSLPWLLWGLQHHPLPKNSPKTLHKLMYGLDFTRLFISYA